MVSLDRMVDRLAGRARSIGGGGDPDAGESDRGAVPTPSGDDDDEPASDPDPAPPPTSGRDESGAPSRDTTGGDVGDDPTPRRSRDPDAGEPDRGDVPSRDPGPDRDPTPPPTSGRDESGTPRMDDPAPLPDPDSGPDRAPPPTPDPDAGEPDRGTVPTPSGGDDEPASDPDPAPPPTSGRDESGSRRGSQRSPDAPPAGGVVEGSVAPTPAGDAPAIPGVAGALSDAEQGVRAEIEGLLELDPSDVEVTDVLTQSGGFFTEQEERELRESGRRARERFSFEEDIEDFAGDVGAGFEQTVPGAFGELGAGVIEFGGGVAGGVGNIPGDVAGLVEGEGLALAETGVETVENIPTAVDRFGARATATAITSTAGAAGTTFGEQAQRDPASFIGQVGGELVLGVGAGKALERAPSLARSASIRARGGQVVDFEDVSDPPRTLEGDLPGFSEGAVDDATRAEREFLEQGRRTELAGNEPVAFHGRTAADVSEFGGFRGGFEAPEVPPRPKDPPGMAFSADLSPLRLPGATEGGPSIPRPRLPRPRFRTSKIAAERGVDVDVMEGRTIDEATSFMEAADRERSFVRSTEIMSPEQEVFAPEGAQFTDIGEPFGVRFGGDVIPGRMFRRGEAPDVDDVPPAARGEIDVEAFGEEFTSIDELSRRLRRRQEGEPFVPVAPSARARGVTTQTPPGSRGLAAGDSPPSFTPPTETPPITTDPDLGEPDRGAVPTPSRTTTEGSGVPPSEPPTGPPSTPPTTPTTPPTTPPSTPPPTTPTIPSTPTPPTIPSTPTPPTPPTTPTTPPSTPPPPPTIPSTPPPPPPPRDQLELPGDRRRRFAFDVEDEFAKSFESPIITPGEFLSGEQDPSLGGGELTVLDPGGTPTLTSVVGRENAPTAAQRTLADIPTERPPPPEPETTEIPLASDPFDILDEPDGEDLLSDNT